VQVGHDDFSNEDPVTVIDRLARSLPKAAAESYLVVKKDKNSKLFTNRFITFWSKLVSSIPDTFFFEESSVDSLMDWLIATSKYANAINLFCRWFMFLFRAKRQSFRHTAMDALYGMMDGLIEAYLTKEQQFNVVSKRLETEKKKKGKAKNSEKIKQFTGDQKELEDHMSSFEHYISGIFDK
jgi:hypothetical protein